MSEKQDVIAGILEQARSEASQIVSDAETTVKVRRETLESRLQRIESDAAERAEREALKIRQKTDAAVAVERRRARLARQQRMYRTVVERVRTRFADMIGSPKYERVLEGWIAEAAIGLEADAATVRVSPSEQDAANRVLDGASDTAARFLGRECRLSLDTDNPTRMQGAVVTSSDGATAYNNQVETRIARFEPEIRSVLAESLPEAEE